MSTDEQIILVGTLLAILPVYILMRWVLWRYLVTAWIILVIAALTVYLTLRSPERRR